MIKNAKLVMPKPFDVNLITKLWKTFTSFRILENKIIELVVVQVIGFVEDEYCFFTLTFMETNL
jgi:hypothetical protein